MRIFKFDLQQWNTVLQLDKVYPAQPHVSVLDALAFDNPRVIRQQAISTISNVDDIESHIRLVEGNTERTYRWFGLSTAYALQGANTTGLQAERISKQILFCRDSLYALSRSYMHSLVNNVTDKNISHGEDGQIHFVSNKHSLDIGYRTQSCLNELYALRDYLLYFLFEDMYCKKISNVSKMIRFLQSDDRFNLATTILPMLSTDPIGKITLMSLYRNVFFHYVGTKNSPLGQAFCFRNASSNFGSIPYLIYPLYDDITRLRAIERGAPLDEGAEEERSDEAKRFIQLKDYTDAMEFCYDSFLACWVSRPQLRDARVLNREPLC